MKKTVAKPCDPKVSWMALYEFIKLIKKVEIEQRGIGEAGRVQYTTDILLRNVLDGIQYNASCKRVNLSKKYPWLKKNTKN